MTFELILTIYHSFGAVIFILGAQGLVFFPLTLAYELWKRRFLRGLGPFTGKVTVVVPAYNEEKTIRASLASILASDYQSLEVIVVNDGSTDSTEEMIADFIRDGRIRYIKKPNGGKASALNMGIGAADGEVVLFTDADSIFLRDTVSKTVRWFASPLIDAVCGNDAPLHPSTPVQRFLAITTHIGTGFVRRALSVTRCLPIITGNLGAVRTTVLKELKGFREVWGEDLEITFRLYKHGKRIIFDPDPKVIAECPSTLGGLWKQRIRWVRSYLKISYMHRDIFFSPGYAPFSLYLPINFLNMAVVPLLQIALLFIIPWAYSSGHLYFTDSIEAMAWLGIVFFAFISVYSIILDRAWADFVYLPYGLLILPLSYFYNFVALYSWWKEIRGAEERWDKIERRRVFAAKRPRWEYAAVALLFAALSATGTYLYMSWTEGPRYAASFDLGLSTHFDAWGDWRKATSNILGRQDVGLARVMGISAGRPEWAYFKWGGHKDRWSNHQKGAREDLLAKAVTQFHRTGFKVAAFVDIYGPKYISENPEKAAMGFDGKLNSEQLSFMEIVEGEYGRMVVEMVGYIAAHYDVDIIDLTELPYYNYSYNAEDLKSYSAFSKRPFWPTTADGKIDRDDPSIGEWRSALMEGFIRRAAEAAHAGKKELYVDVPVSWRDFKINGRDSGLDYRRVLRYADNIVVWDYFDLEGLPPEASEGLARYLADNFPQNSFYVSIGLWGKNGNVDPQRFSVALMSTLKGGVRRIWVTPDSLITEAHWKEVLNYLRIKRP